MKTCSKCNKTKPYSEFSKCSRYKDGHYGQCKQCRLEYQRIWNKNNIEKCRQKNNKYYARNKEKRRNKDLKYRYGISSKDYKQMLQSQDGVCLICKKKPKNRRLSVDHNHTTSEIRGLLCQKCNAILGLAGDNVKILQNAIEYLTAPTS